MNKGQTFSASASSISPLSSSYKTKAKRRRVKAFLSALTFLFVTNYCRFILTKTLNTDIIKAKENQSFIIISNTEAQVAFLFSLQIF